MEKGKYVSMRKIFSSGIVWLWIAVFILILDRLAKTWMLHNLTPGDPLYIFPFFNLILVFNTGAAFSFLNSASGWQSIFLGCLAVAVSAVILIWLMRVSLREWWLCIALNFILGGALGNVWDRILYGHVVDFLDFHLGDWHFAIFNTADSAITIGAFMLILHWFLYPNR